MQERQRIDGVDFWRGFVLLTIFINHVPGNAFERLTHRNIGFSDAAEAFVFLSGVSVALAYGARFLSGEAGRGARALGRRALALYSAQVALSFSAIAIFAAAAILFDDDSLMADHGKDLVLSDPARASLAIIGLSHQLGYFNILPLYVVLLLATPALLTLARRDVRLMLAASAAVYALSRALSLNLPTWPIEGGWFFNPFAWQFLFAIGVFAGLRLRGKGIPHDGGLFGLCVVVLALSALVVTDGLWLLPGLADSFSAVLDLAKTDLGLVRLAHFLALAYVLYHCRITALLRRSPLYASLSLIGRHSLPVFAANSILSAIGQIILATRATHLLDDFALIGGGILLHYFLARRLAARALTRRARS